MTLATLHIEHAITDLATWLAAFDRFADARRMAGVRTERLRQPVDDAGYIVIDLDFATVEEAASFLRFLREQVWAIPGNAPALAGTPETMILDDIR